MIWQLLSLLVLSLICLWGQPATPLRCYYWGGLLFKTGCGLALGWLYMYYLGAGDTIAFHKGASALYQTSLTSFSSYLSELLSPQHAVFKGEARNELLTKILSVFYLFTRGSYWLSSVCFSLISFMGAWFLIKTIYRYFPDLFWPAAMAFLFFPSAVFWTSGILKEALVFCAVCYLAAICTAYYHSRGLGLWHAAGTALALLVLFYLKFYLAAVCGLLMGVLAWVSVLEGFPLGRKFRIAITILGISLIGVLVTQLNYNLHLAHLPQAIVDNYQAISRATVGSQLAFPDLEATYTSLAWHLPQGLVAGLFRPFIWEVSSHTLLYGVENLFLLLLAGYHLPYLKKLNPTLPGWLMIAYILILATMLPLASPNFGTLVRYKAVFLPFLAFSLLMLPYQRILSKR